PQRQPVLGGVGQLHQLLDGGETHHRGDGAEDLLCVCGCVCIDTVQDRGPVEQVLVGTPGTQAGTGLDAAGDQAVDLVALAGVDDRTQCGALLLGAAHGQFVGPSGQAFDVGVGDLFVHQMATGGHTDLTLVQEGAPSPGGGGRLHVGIVQDHQWGVSAQFQVGAFEVTRSGLTDLAACCGGAGEGKNSHVRVGDQGLSGFCTSGQDVEEAFGNPGPAEDLGQDRTAADGGALVGFEDHGVAQGQCRGHRADPENEGNVEGGDDPHHTCGDLSGKTQSGFGGTQDLAVRLVGKGSGLEALLGRHVYLEGGHACGCASLVAQPVADLVGVGVDQVPGPA